ncbi:MAG: hypothetical protein L3J13_08390, partial [Devosiaceae bacterium]|nr:hypothetical protein [Devosiaceae bacterium]
KEDSMKNSSKSSILAPMTTRAAARVQSTTARATGGQTPKGSFAARAQRAAAKNSAGKRK